MYVDVIFFLFLLPLNFLGPFLKNFWKKCFQNFFKYLLISIFISLFLESSYFYVSNFFYPP